MRKMQFLVAITALLAASVAHAVQPVSKSMERRFLRSTSQEVKEPSLRTLKGMKIYDLQTRVPHVRSYLYVKGKRAYLNQFARGANRYTAEYGLNQWFKVKLPKR